jgi:fructose-bisphosphate aldolase, class I
MGNGSAMFLPYDQGLEHGPRDFSDNPAAGDPRYIIRLAVEGGFNGVAIQVGNASRTASELGADIVKLNFPDPRATEGVPKAYAAETGEQHAVDAVVRSAARTPVLLSGGEKGGDEEVLDKARMAMEAGALGVIFGRNVWQRRHDESLRFVERLRELLSKYPS